MQAKTRLFLTFLFLSLTIKMKPKKLKMKKIKMLAKTLSSLIFFTSSLMFLYRAALLEVLSNKLHIKGIAKQKEENGMNASL